LRIARLGRVSVRVLARDLPHLWTGSRFVKIEWNSSLGLHASLVDLEYLLNSSNLVSQSHSGFHHCGDRMRRNPPVKTAGRLSAPKSAASRPQRARANFCGVRADRTLKLIIASTMANKFFCWQIGSRLFFLLLSVGLSPVGM
jgi:hypothetical protein